MTNSSVLAEFSGSSLRPLQSEEFQRFKHLLYESFGIDLRQGKEELVAARLGKKVRELGFRTYSQYFDYVTNQREGSALPDMVDLLTTNHTAFFREPAHFDLLRLILARLKSQREQINVWCAASSSGEEPYSIAITALEETAAGRVGITATDLSTRVLKTAQTGVYAADRLTGVPSELLRKYFLRGEGKASGFFRVKSSVASHVVFDRLNLVEPYSHPTLFSMIWCRNVMIYFDKPTQARVVNRLSEWLEPGGYLFIGHSEALNGVSHSLKYIQPAVYRKP